jgi:hypothetical protein
VSLALDLRRALDPVTLARRIGMDPDEWQERALRSQAGRLLLNCSRQSGKSTTAALLAVWTALYEPGSLVLVLSPSQRQSQELFRLCLRVYRTLGRPVPPEAENQLSLALETGSRIVSLPGQEGTIRGFPAVRLLIVDEAARVSDETYFSARPFLAVSGGRIVTMSTPFGKRGWWWEAWEDRDGEPWERYLVPATEVPRISPDFLVQEKRTLGDWWFAQEYLCEFQDAQGAVFRTEDIEAMLRGGAPWDL